MKIEHGRPRAAIAGAFAGGRAVGPAPRAGRWRVAALLAAGIAATPLAYAATSGERGASLPAEKLVADALTYSSFSGACSQTAFDVDAVGMLAVSGGPITGPGTTTLDGVPFDSYTLDLKTGPDTFVTTFDRTFAPALPTANYEMVFTTHVMLGGVEQGVSITTIRCSDGVVFARNKAVPSVPPAVPVGGLAAWAALSLLLAAAAASLVPARRG